MLFSEAIPKFAAWKQYSSKVRTAYSYANTLKQFALFMRNPQIEDITYDNIIEYLNIMTDLGWDRNSYIGKCVALRKFFEFFHLQGITVVDYNLIPLPDREYKFPNSLTDSNVATLLSALPLNKDHMHILRNRAIIYLLWNCGMRVGELVSLNVKDIDLVNKKALIKTEKSKGLRPIRQIMWTEECNEHLKKWLVARKKIVPKIRKGDEEALFVSTKTVNQGRRLLNSGVEEVLRKLSEVSNLGFNCNPHRFRHAFGRDLAKKGANNSVISSLMGHASLQSSYVYTMMDDKMLEEQYTKYRR